MTTIEKISIELALFSLVIFLVFELCHYINKVKERNKNIKKIIGLYYALERIVSTYGDSKKISPSIGILEKTFINFLSNLDYEYNTLLNIKVLLIAFEQNSQDEYKLWYKTIIDDLQINNKFSKRIIEKCEKDEENVNNGK